MPFGQPWPARTPILACNPQQKEVERDRHQNAREADLDLRQLIRPPLQVVEAAHLPLRLQGDKSRRPLALRPAIVAATPGDGIEQGVGETVPPCTTNAGTLPVGLTASTWFSGVRSWACISLMWSVSPRSCATTRTLRAKGEVGV